MWIWLELHTQTARAPRVLVNMLGSSNFELLVKFRVCAQNARREAASALVHARRKYQLKMCSCCYVFCFCIPLVNSWFAIQIGGFKTDTIRAVRKRGDSSLSNANECAPSYGNEIKDVADLFSEYGRLQLKMCTCCYCSMTLYFLYRWFNLRIPVTNR